MAKILVVEDEPDLRQAVVEELNDEGHITIEAGNGQEGLDRLTTETPDLVLSDITMPKMNGYQFYRSVKENHPEHILTPFIFLSALSDRDNELKGLRLGVDDYLTKPVDFDLMIARIDLALRRRQAIASIPAQNSPAATQTQQEGDQGEAASAGERDGFVPTGKFKTASPDVLRATIGDRWSELSDLILKCAEATIRTFLGPKDVLHATPSRDFLTCFSDLTDDQVHAKVGTIRDAVWEALFKQTNDEALSYVDAQVLELPLDLQGGGDEEAMFSEVDDLIDQHEAAARAGSQERLQQLHQQEEFHALSLLSPKGTPSKIKMLAFEAQSNELANRLLGGSSCEGPFLLELLKTLFDRLKEKQSLKDAFHQMGMVLPIRFQVISDPEARDGVVQLCKDLEQTIEAMPIVEVTGTPDRIQFGMDALKPLPVGRQLQFLELRRKEQMDDLSLSELSDQGIAFVSMSFDHVVQHEEQSLRQFIKALEINGVKFLIKDIPEGRLPDAQSYHAHLFAMQE